MTVTGCPSLPKDVHERVRLTLGDKVVEVLGRVDGDRGIFNVLTERETACLSTKKSLLHHFFQASPSVYYQVQKGSRDLINVCYI